MSILKITKPKTFFWTNHAKAKMSFYRLSEQRIRRVLNSPKRIEEGVAPKTVAMMQPPTIKWKMTNGKREKEVWSQEIWVMVEDTKTKRKIISAWRYPGMTKHRGGDLSDFFKKEYMEYLEKL